MAMRCAQWRGAPARGLAVRVAAVACLVWPALAGCEASHGTAKDSGGVDTLRDRNDGGWNESARPWGPYVWLFELDPTGAPRTGVRLGAFTDVPPELLGPEDPLAGKGGLYVWRVEVDALARSLRVVDAEFFLGPGSWDAAVASGLLPADPPVPDPRWPLPDGFAAIMPAGSVIETTCELGILDLRPELAESVALLWASDCGVDDDFPVSVLDCRQGCCVEYAFGLTQDNYLVSFVDDATFQAWPYPAGGLLTVNASTVGHPEWRQAVFEPLCGTARLRGLGDWQDFEPCDWFNLVSDPALRCAIEGPTGPPHDVPPPTADAGATDACCPAPPDAQGD